MLWVCCFYVNDIFLWLLRMYKKWSEITPFDVWYKTDKSLTMRFNSVLRLFFRILSLHTRDYLNLIHSYGGGSPLRSKLTCSFETMKAFWAGKLKKRTCILDDWLTIANDNYIDTNFGRNFLQSKDTFFQ